MKNPVKVLILRIVNLYRGSSIKPFGGFLRRLYLRYFQEKMKEDKMVASKIDGIKYELNLNQYSELETHYGGGYEPEVIKIFNKYVKPGMTIIDIGARIGLHTMRLKKLVGKEGQVIAFEPDNITFLRLVENARLNNFDIVAENKALSDKSSGKEVALDDFFKENKIKKLDFIKLDTDGYEYQIIKGGLNTLRKFNPVMVIEFNKNAFENGSLEPMIDLLRSVDYSFFRRTSLEEYPDKESIFSEFDIKNGVNILCKPKNK
ncbi:MAG: FkbM family methyltransferase [Candidatus Nealsonbacteria bacterium]